MSPLRIRLAVAVFVAVTFTCRLNAQNGPCPTFHSTDSGAATPRLSGDVICTVPQVYGPGGLVGNNHGGPLAPTENNTNFEHTVHFRDAALASLTPLTSEIGTQLSQLPFTSPASGFIFTFNPSVGVVTQTTQTFGPILTERADTIGRHKLYVGVSYQFFNFDRVDGTNLRRFGAVFQHEHEPCENAPTAKPCLADDTPLPTKDFIYTSNRIDLKVHQITAVATFGVTSRLDLSVAIPILDVRMSMFSDATIKDFEGSASAGYVPSCPTCVHQFVSPAAVPGERVSTADPIYGNNHATFSRGTAASGIGDVVFRGKYEIAKTERFGAAVGLDLRVPSGDVYNFLGAGSYGVRPFLAFSYNWRVSPHASLGYQRNGDSVLAGDITHSTKAAPMPSVFTFSFGADAAINRRISATADFLGQTIYNVQTVNPSAFTDYCEQNNCPGVAKCNCTYSDISSAATYRITQDSMALGAKFNPVAKLLVTANVLFRVNDAGLHSKPVPLIGLSYSF